MDAYIRTEGPRTAGQQAEADAYAHEVALRSTPSPYVAVRPGGRVVSPGDYVRALAPALDAMAAVLVAVKDARTLYVRNCKADGRPGPVVEAFPASFGVAIESR